MKKPPAVKEIRTLADLTPDPQNARAHTPRNIGMIADSLQEVGFARSIVIDEGGVILAGNGVAEAAGQVGMEAVRVVEADGDELIVVRRANLTPAQKTRLALFDNRATDLSSFDPAVLATLDPPLLEGLWRPEELAELLATIPPDVGPGGGGDAFAGDPNPEQTRVQPGDIWQVGAHRIGCLDCTDPAALARLLGDAAPSFVWSDPPYGVKAVGKDGRIGSHGRAEGYPFGGTKNDGKRKPIGSGNYAPVVGDDSTATALAAVSLALTLWPKALHIWWGANNYSEALPPSTCWLVWDKENDTSDFADAELAWTNQETAVRIFRHKWNGLIKASERGERRVHPTQKPVALPEWAFGKYGKADDVIFDGFAGSGISLIAAHRAGGRRRVFACELSAAYVDMVLTRATAEGIAPITRLELGAESA